VGQGLFHVYDHQTARHFKLGLQEVSWLKLLDGERPQAELRGQIPEEYFDDFFAHLDRMELVEKPAAPRKRNLGTIKLIRLDPDAVLGRLERYAPAYRQFLAAVTLPVALFNLATLAMAASRAPQVTHDLQVTPAIIAFYIPAVLLAGALHELSHAMIARAHGVRVPAMGLMLLFLHPAFYADVSGISLLPNRSSRLEVLSAGIKVNSILAALSSIAYACAHGTPLATYLLLFSLLNLTMVGVNLIPFIPFDGYFLFEELVDEPRFAANALQSLLGRSKTRGEYVVFVAAAQVFRAAAVCLAIVGLRSLVTRYWSSAPIDYAFLALLITAYVALALNTARRGV
jgi:putative peptide zinc metalloprotease protein